MSAALVVSGVETPGGAKEFRASVRVFTEAFRPRPGSEPLSSAGWQKREDRMNLAIQKMEGRKRPQRLADER